MLTRNTAHLTTPVRAALLRRTVPINYVPPSLRACPRYRKVTEGPAEPAYSPPHVRRAPYADGAGIRRFHSARSRAMIPEADLPQSNINRVRNRCLTSYRRA
jgi:hypothetical protein